MEPDRSLKHTKHIVRLAILLGAVLTGIILGRSLFVPKSWGEYGWYRGDAVAEFMAKPVVHGGDDSCRDCHAKQYQEHADGVHATVRCEVCHEPVTVHVANGKKIAPMPIPLSFELCTRCHRQLAARPKDFPQVNPEQHLADAEMEMSPTVCTECHDPHSPI